MTTKLTDWIGACCSLAPGGREHTSDLFDSYRGWATNAGAKPVGMTIFLKLLREHGVGVVQTNASGDVRGPIALVAGPQRTSDRRFGIAPKW